MADYKIFKINNVDYTQYLRTEEYNVMRADVIDTWTDGNRITRGFVTRTRITGSLRLVFRASEYNTFLNNMQTAKNADGTYNIECHVNNDNTGTETVSIKAFIEMNRSVVFGLQSYEYIPTAMVVNIDIEEA